MLIPLFQQTRLQPVLRSKNAMTYSAGVEQQVELVLFTRARLEPMARAMPPRFGHLRAGGCLEFLHFVLLGGGTLILVSVDSRTHRSFVGTPEYGTRALSPSSFRQPFQSEVCLESLIET